MEPRAFLDAAHVFVQNSGPAQLRSAISRAYYAAFHASVAILLGLGLDLPSSRAGRRRGDDHRFVQLCWLNSGDGQVARIGRQLGDLRVDRNKADYDLQDEDAEDADVAAYCVELAGRLLQALERVFDDERHCARIQGALQTLDHDGTLQALLED